MNLFDVYPLQDVTVARARGSWVWDTDGRRYLDMYGGHAVISIGHTHPHYVRRLTEQLKKIGFYSNSVKMPIQKELAEKLGQVSKKPDYQLFLCNSGAEANENALKLASFHTGRRKVVAFRGAFHGRTSLAVSATDNPKIIAPVNRTDKVVFLPFNDVASLRAFFKKEGGDIAAVITEGIQGVGGIRPASTAFLQEIRALCTEHGAVFVADSVQCGYGRSGQFFAHDFAGITADIYSVAKGMGNGFPVAAILIAPHLKPWHGMLGTTFGGNPLACAAALAVLETIEQENLTENAGAIGGYLLDELRDLPGVLEVRGRGLMIGIELPETWTTLKKDLLYKDGIFTGEAKPNVIRLLPALTLTRQQAGLFLKAFKKRLKTQPGVNNG